MAAICTVGALQASIAGFRRQRDDSSRRLQDLELLTAESVRVRQLEGDWWCCSLPGYLLLLELRLMCSVFSGVHVQW